MRDLTWAELVGEVDFDELMRQLESESTEGLPTGIPIAERLDDIPAGLPEAFIDKFAIRSISGKEAGLTFGVEEIGSPVGQWATFPSTWLSMARWEPDNQGAGSLYVEFLSLAMVRYDGVSAQMWTEMIASRSKGQWVYYKLAYPNGKGNPGWPYTLLRFPSRPVTQRMRDTHYQRTHADGADFHLRLAA